MKRWLWIFLLACPALPQYQIATPGYHYQFPRDFFNHPQFQTEWWYYTGNLHAPNGHRFGFELTFFRLGASHPPRQNSSWAVRNVYMAHCALSDLTGHRFLYRERLNRAGPGLAGIDFDRRLIWNGNWNVQWLAHDQRLQAVTETFTLDLQLTSLKPPVINGRDGISRKGPRRGEASYYISLTRLQAKGKITLEGTPYSVSGSAWMDHEFFTQQLDPLITGWDWLCLQLEDHSEFMFYRLRLKQGGISPYSSGTYVDSGGHPHFLDSHEFSLLPEKTWTSPYTHARYPIQWRIEVPSLQLDLSSSTPLNSQELAGHNALSPTYWEGAIDLNGKEAGKPLKGMGYLEMTGYAEPLGKANY